MPLQRRKRRAKSPNPTEMEMGAPTGPVPAKMMLLACPLLVIRMLPAQSC